MTTEAGADVRKERARQTRRRMVEAAYALFCERGYAVPLTAVATEAGVAVQTLYFTFHTKLDLLREVLQLAVLGDDLPTPPHERPWFAQLVAEPDLYQAALILLEGTQGIYDRLGPLSGVFRSGDPEVAQMWQHSERLRYDGMAVVTRALLAKLKPKAAVSAERATDIVFVLLSADTYQAFVVQRGWTPKAWREWTAQALVDALSARPTRGR